MSSPHHIEDRLLPPLDGSAGPALPIAASLAAQMVQAALHAVPRPAPAPAVRRWPRRRIAWIAGVTTTAAAAGAFAAFLAQHVPSPHAPPAQPYLAPPRARPVPGRQASPPAPEAPTAPAAEPPAAHVEPHASASARRGKRAAVHPPEAIPDVLARANALRSERRWAEAARLYDAVAKGSPQTGAGRAATLALAELRRDHLGDPRGAARLLEDLLRNMPKGLLREESLWALAACYRRLHDHESERRALVKLVSEADAGSLLRGRGAARLQEMP